MAPDTCRRPDSTTTRAYALRVSQEAELKLRKHRQQMSQAEIATAEAIVHNLSGWDASGIHARREMRNDRLTDNAVLDALTSGQIIEVNSFGRVVMRSSKGAVVVAELPNKYVVTAWYNDPRDNHSTLRLNEYTWRVDAADYLRRIQ
jgi:hypothetical protein